jgi:hypothetical protein
VEEAGFKRKQVEEAATKQKWDEAAAQKKGEEAATAQKKREEEAAKSGGVLGYTETNIGFAQITTALRQEITPQGKAAGIATLLKASALTIAFNALEAGTAVIEWYEPARREARQEEPAQAGARGVRTDDVRWAGEGRDEGQIDRRRKTSAQGDRQLEAHGQGDVHAER